jgi:hypothetical protein
MFRVQMRQCQKADDPEGSEFRIQSIRAVHSHPMKRPEKEKASRSSRDPFGISPGDQMDISITGSGIKGISDFGLRNADCGFFDFGFWILDFGLGIFQFRISNCGMRIENTI